MGLRQRSALAALCVVLAGANAAAETRRLAVVAGNNAGTGELPPLRFAENDAGKMARVLVELGDVSPDDVMLLQGRRVADLERAIADARERVAFFKKAPDTRTVLVFYFSGHSDGEAIELGSEKLPYARLKALLAGTGADVRVAIVDACRSGMGLREKGGRTAAPFTIHLADTLQATGDAFITSSAADEAALESSEVGGSYFTHNLLSGLRGAADLSGDKLITLAEAYQYAYDRTVSATAALPVGAQHPNYDFRLSGQGELVLASLLKPSATLVLPDGADRSLVTDMRRDQVVVEVGVIGAHDIALTPGQYGLRLFKGGQVFGGRVSLGEGERRVVAWNELAATSASVVVARKGSAEVRRSLEAMEDTAPIGLAVGFGGTARLVPIIFDAANPVMPKWQLRLGLEPVGHRMGSFNLFGRPRLGVATVRGDLTLLGLGELSAGDTSPTAPNEGGAQLRVGYRVSLEWWRLTLGLGVEIGPGFVTPMTAGAPVLSAVLVGAPHATVRIRLAGPVWLGIDSDIAIIGAQYRESETAEQELRWYAFPSVSAGVVVFF